jgi:hypothetical protein
MNLYLTKITITTEFKNNGHWSMGSGLYYNMSNSCSEIQLPGNTDSVNELILKQMLDTE